MEYPEKFIRLRAALRRRREEGEKGKMDSGFDVWVVDAGIELPSEFTTPACSVGRGW